MQRDEEGREQNDEEAEAADEDNYGSARESSMDEDDEDPDQTLVNNNNSLLNFGRSLQMKQSFSRTKSHSAILLYRRVRASPAADGGDEE
jgi:hypothetical protein